VQLEVKIENFVMANKILRKTRLRFLIADLWHHYATFYRKMNPSDIEITRCAFLSTVFKKPFNVT